MNVVQLTFIVTINMMGSGIIMLPTNMAKVGAISLLSWVVTALGSMAMAYGFAQAGIYNQRPGGLAAYAEDAYGKDGYFQTFFLYFLSLAIANVAVAVSALGFSINARAQIQRVRGRVSRAVLRQRGGIRRGCVTKVGDGRDDGAVRVRRWQWRGSAQAGGQAGAQGVNAAALRGRSEFTDACGHRIRTGARATAPRGEGAAFVGISLSMGASQTNERAGHADSAAENPPDELKQSCQFHSEFVS
jgi:hypothetical protein